MLQSLLCTFCFSSSRREWRWKCDWCSYVRSPPAMTMYGDWPAAFSPSATLTGSLPLPAMIATRSPGPSETAGLPSIACIGLVVAVFLERWGEEVALAACVQEFDDLHGRRRTGEFDRRRGEVLRDRPAAIEDSSIGPAGGVNLGPRQAGTAHADDVEAAQLGEIAARD